MRAFALGVLGLTPTTFYWMTPGELASAARGYWEMRERAEWERTLRITGMWGDKATYDKLFKKHSRSISIQEYREMLARRGWTHGDSRDADS